MKPPSNGRRAVQVLSSLCVGAALLASGTAVAQPKALPDGARPADARLGPLKDLDGYFPFVPAADRGAWETRAAQVRRRILVSLGLWPLPTRTPLKPAVYGRVERDGYTVEKVCFESVPGFYVTGNLYRPRGLSGRAPGVLCPHGHWTDGRFLDSGLDEVKKEIAAGAERFEEGGRSVLQSRCVQLARMGCVVFHFDMLGYADSQQIPMAVAHQFAQQRPEMNTRENWGLFSPQAEAHAQSVMGLQAWNSIRALDFLCSLADVDPKRIGVTGASGGGTQTFILGAIDPRPAAIFPAVMVSTAMQGGCTCENACGLRVGTGNVEFAALFAPKPLGLTAANDWTKEMATKGFPELRRHFGLLDAPGQISLTALLQFGHNYNLPSRAAMYRWFNQHLHLGRSEPIEEHDYLRLTREEMSCWDASHPQPPGGPEFERKLLRWFTDDAQRQIEGTARRPQAFRRLAAPAVTTLLGAEDGLPGAPEWKQLSQTDRTGYLESVGLLSCPAAGTELPVVRLVPARPSGRIALWLSREGKRGLWASAADGAAGAALRKPVADLLASGVTVVGVDLFLQGEFLAGGQTEEPTPRVKNTRESAAYTLGYNFPVFAHRVQDVVRVARWLRQGQSRGPELLGVGLQGAGAWLAAARAIEPGLFDRAAIDTQGFRFASVTDIRSADLLPGGAKYLDLPGLLALGAPGPLWLAGEGNRTETLPTVLRNAYRGKQRFLHLADGQQGDLQPEAVRWLGNR